MALGDHLEGRTTALTVAEVAEILSVSERQVYKLAAVDEIPCFRVGGAIRFDPSVIMDWIRRSSAPAKRPPQRVVPALEHRRRG